MLRICATFALICVAVSAPTSSEDQPSKILKYENNNEGDGNYYFSYETSNGIKRDESGVFINKGQSDEHLVVSGSFSYTDPDGKLVSILYSADEKGYHIITPAYEVPVVQGGVPATVVASLLG